MAASPAASGPMPAAARFDWTVAEARRLLARPFADLLHEAQTVHRAWHDPNRVQISTLLSIKTGGCPEDCAYCPQSARYDTGLERGRLLDVDAVRDAARRAAEHGASRFCMGAAWRAPSDRDLERVAEMVEAVRAEGLETCATLGMLRREQAERLAGCGLDYYNHNLDTSPEFYGEIITTRDYRERLETLAHVRAAGIRVCCGGILGMGESRADRAGLLCQLAGQEPHPESVPINLLVRVPGTPLGDAAALDPLEFARTVAAARIMLPAATVRLSAGREGMSDELQALCFLAGANSIFHGEKLLTAPNADAGADRALFARLGLAARDDRPRPDA